MSSSAYDLPSNGSRDYWLFSFAAGMVTWIVALSTVNIHWAEALLLLGACALVPLGCRILARLDVGWAADALLKPAAVFHAVAAVSLVGSFGLPAGMTA